jgi:hypothetical protein
MVQMDCDNQKSKHVLKQAGFVSLSSSYLESVSHAGAWFTISVVISVSKSVPCFSTFD